MPSLSESCCDGGGCKLPELLELGVVPDELEPAPLDELETPPDEDVVELLELEESLPPPELLEPGAPLELELVVPDELEVPPLLAMVVLTSEDKLLSLLEESKAAKAK